MVYSIPYLAAQRSDRCEMIVANDLQMIGRIRQEFATSLFDPFNMNAILGENLVKNEGEDVKKIDTATALGGYKYTALYFSASVSS